MHSCATERKKGEKWVQKTNFLANGKSLNHFNNTTPNMLTFNLNSFGTVGQYVDLTFNVTYTDSAAVSHTITGSIHALRDN